MPIRLTLQALYGLLGTNGSLWMARFYFFILIICCDSHNLEPSGSGLANRKWVEKGGYW